MEHKISLYKKISQVMKDVSYLQKDDNIKFGNTNYKAISEEKVTITVRESLIKNGLIILPIDQVHKREDTVLSKTYKGETKESIDRLTTTDVKYRIIDIDTGEFEEVVSSGTGVDTQDKGVGKAMTYAYKYMLLRAFAIPTGEDPDKVSSAELDEKQGKEKKQSKAESEAIHKARMKYREILMSDPFIFPKSDIAKYSDKPDWTLEKLNKGIDFLTKEKKSREDQLKTEAYEK